MDRVRIVLRLLPRHYFANYAYFLTVGVAQLVEPLVVAQVVVGSSPITHPIENKAVAYQKMQWPFCFQGSFSLISVLGFFVINGSIRIALPPSGRILKADCP